MHEGLGGGAVVSLLITSNRERGVKNYSAPFLSGQNYFFVRFNSTFC